MAVEHTSFIWPPDEVGWDSAVQRLREEVKESTAGKIQGVLVLSIDHEGVEAFRRNYEALGKRRQITTWLADEIVERGRDLAVGHTLVLSGPITFRMDRVSWEGSGVAINQSLSRGGDLGFILGVDMASDRLVVERHDKPLGVLSCYEELLSRKAGSLVSTGFAGGILLIDDYSLCCDDLIYLSKVLSVPTEISELYIWSVRDSVLLSASQLRSS